MWGTGADASAVCGGDTGLASEAEVAVDVGGGSLTTGWLLGSLEESPVEPEGTRDFFEAVGADSASSVDGLFTLTRGAAGTITSVAFEGCAVDGWLASEADLAVDFEGRFSVLGGLLGTLEYSLVEFEGTRKFSETADAESPLSTGGLFTLMRRGAGAKSSAASGSEGDRTIVLGVGPAGEIGDAMAISGSGCLSMPCEVDFHSCVCFSCSTTGGLEEELGGQAEGSLGLECLVGGGPSTLFSGRGLTPMTLACLPPFFKPAECVSLPVDFVDAIG
jgi:hypothetical protein